MLHGPMALPWKNPQGVAYPVPAAAIPAAGYVPGVPRLHIPALYETDASLGVANPNGIRPGDVATALPASLALASTFDPELAHAAGAVVGAEARAKGFNVLLGGGMNLARDPRNGRNFEYLGEDPLLAGAMAGAEVRGTQDEHVVSTVKHFALNANETNRHHLDARIGRAALRESDLLAFQIAIERGHPGAVMCSYNLVNGQYACGNHWLLTDVLKTGWGYPGWVMSDWGAVDGLGDALAGLDQQSGQQLDAEVFFGAPLEASVKSGAIPAARVDDMVRRILRSLFAVGVDLEAAGAPLPAPGIDYPAHAAVALDIARKGAVLLKNTGILPLPATLTRIAVIGGHADAGVMSGGGSSQVLPSNGAVMREDEAIYDPSAPRDALAKALPHAAVEFDPGDFPARAAAVAAKAQVAIVFVTRLEHEGADVPDLDPPDGQTGLVEAVARANPRTIVVLEAGNPVAMPWIDGVSAVLMAWYPGQEGGRAIADLLVGAINPSGRLPLTMPRDIKDFLRPSLPNLGADPEADVHVDYDEGEAVGYRWYARQGVEPLFPFGFGLSYTRFDYSQLVVTGGRNLGVSLKVRNAGTRAGADVPQVYLTGAAGRRVLRLIGFQRVELAPGETRTITLEADRRLLGGFDEGRGRWSALAGVYTVTVGRYAGDSTLKGEAVLDGFDGN